MPIGGGSSGGAGGNISDVVGSGEIGVVTVSKVATVSIDSPVTLEHGGLETDVSGYNGVPLISSGATSEIKYNLTATTDPTISDDDTQGYVIGSRWINTSTDNEFVCTDNSTGAAVWEGTTGGSSSYPALFNDLPPAIVSEDAPASGIYTIQPSDRGKLLVADGITCTKFVMPDSGAFADNFSVALLDICDDGNILTGIELSTTSNIINSSNLGGIFFFQMVNGTLLDSNPYGADSGWTYNYSIPISSLGTSSTQISPLVTGPDVFTGEPNQNITPNVLPYYINFMLSSQTDHNGVHPLLGAWGILQSYTIVEFKDQTPGTGWSGTTQISGNSVYRGLPALEVTITITQTIVPVGTTSGGTYDIEYLIPLVSGQYQSLNVGQVVFPAHDGSPMDIIFSDPYGFMSFGLSEDGTSVPDQNSTFTFIASALQNGVMQNPSSLMSTYTIKDSDIVIVNALNAGSTVQVPLIWGYPFANYSNTGGVNPFFGSCVKAIPEALYSASDTVITCSVASRDVNGATINVSNVGANPISEVISVSAIGIGY